MNLRLFIGTIAAFIVTAQACQPARDKKATESEALEMSAPACTNSQSLPLPIIPDSLQSVDRRAGYLALHFWDKMDFYDGQLLRDTAFVEQAFADYLSVIKMVDSPDICHEAIAALMKQASANRTALDIITHTAAKYLDDPNSPLRDEELYIPFLEYLASSDRLTEAEKTVPAKRLEYALKNRVGSKATDFTLQLRDGTDTSLHKITALSEQTLLIFYDPDCDMCHNIMDKINNWQLKPGLQVVAVDVEDNKDLWIETAGSMPEQWQVGFAITPVVDDELYYLPARPVVYLLSRDATVIAKDIAV